MFTENEVIAPPAVATIMQNTGKKAKEKLEHSFIVEQHNPIQSVKLYVRKIEIINVDTVENVVDKSLLFISELKDLKNDASRINTITIVPAFKGPSDCLIITFHICSNTRLMDISVRFS